MENIGRKVLFLKRIIAILLSILMVASTSVTATVSASAKLKSNVLGDVDLNGTLDITDATRIQRHISNIVLIENPLSLFMSDTDGDGLTTILDATAIQRKLAGLNNQMYANTLQRIEDTEFRVDISPNEGEIKANDIVTFKVECSSVFKPLKYEFTLDGKKMQEMSENNIFIAQLSEGEHKLNVKITNIAEEVDIREYVCTIPAAEEPTDDRPTESSSQDSTEAPTQIPTEPYTEAPTQKPTEPSTEAPTEKLTETPTQIPTEPTSAGKEFQANQAELDQFILLNKYRQDNGVANLQYSSDLSMVARLKAEDIATNNYQGHKSPTYGYTDEMLDQFGISWSFVGENLAYGYTSATSVTEGWKSSPFHNANMLESEFTTVGIGYVEGANIWVQIFIKP